MYSSYVQYYKWNSLMATASSSCQPLPTPSPAPTDPPTTNPPDSIPHPIEPSPTTSTPLQTQTNEVTTEVDQTPSDFPLPNPVNSGLAAGLAVVVIVLVVGSCIVVAAVVIRNFQRTKNLTLQHGHDNHLHSKHLYDGGTFTTHQASILFLIVKGEATFTIVQAIVLFCSILLCYNMQVKLAIYI